MEVSVHHWRQDPEAFNSTEEMNVIQVQGETVFPVSTREVQMVR